jgi:hypothetical protein
MNDAAVLIKPVSFRLRVSASEVLQRSAEPTPTLQPTNTAGAVLLWPKKKNSPEIRKEYNTNKAMLLWADHWVPSEPHEELIPWVAWFRPISARNYVWEYTWPEEEYLHP